MFWKEWGILTVAAFLGGLAAVPAQWPAVVQMMKTGHQSALSVLALPVVELALQTAIGAGLGLFFARRSALGVPVVEGWLKGEKVGPRLKSILAPALVGGVMGAALVMAVDRFLFRPLLPGFSTIITQLGGWQGFLASFYGGIFEENQMRLFLLSLVAWLVGRISHTAQNTPSRGAMWLAMIVSAVVFGLLHLPATSLTVALTPLVVVRALALNGGLGMLYGYLYWKRGLEAAMLSHFSSDLVLHFIRPFFL